MRYALLWEYDSARLEQSVNKFIGMGWELQGGVSVSHNEYEHESCRGGRDTKESVVFAQAIVHPKQHP